MEDIDLMMKIIIVGDGRIGKTTLATRFVRNTFIEEYKKTLGVDFLQKKHFIKEIGEEVEFYLWDTAGQEEYNSLTRRYYKGASACIIAFSIIDRDSFLHLERWKDSVENECGQIPIILVQTKIDLVEAAAMTVKETEQIANKLKLPLFRTCAKDNLMVTELFEYLAVKYFGRNLHKQEGHNPIQSVKDIKQQTSISTTFTTTTQTQQLNKTHQSCQSVGGSQHRGILLGASSHKDSHGEQRKNRFFSKCNIL